MFRNYRGLKLRRLIWMRGGVGKIYVMMLEIGLKEGWRAGQVIFEVVISRFLGISSVVRIAGDQSHVHVDNNDIPNPSPQPSLNQ